MATLDDDFNFCFVLHYCKERNMASLLVPLMEWGGFAEWISQVHPACFIYDPPFLVVGCKDGVIVKLSVDKVQFVSGSDNPSHAYPIDFLFKCTFNDEVGEGSGYLAIDRLGSLILLDASDGRCLLFNSLNLDSVYDACAQENLLWIFQDDGVIKIIEMSTLKLLATHKEVKHGKLLATSVHSDALVIVYQQASKSLIKVKLSWSGSSGIVKEAEEMLELEEEAISAEILKDDGAAYSSHSAVHFPNGESISIDSDQKYLGHRTFVKTEDGNFVTESFSFPKRSLKRGLSFLHKLNSSFELIDVESNSTLLFIPHSIDYGVTKTYFDHSTLTVYKGYGNGGLKRLIAENVFSENDSVEFERKDDMNSSAIVTIYHSRRSGKIWTGHLNGDYSQWDPITRTCTSVITGVHREAPILFIESPEGWEPKIILSIAADHSLSISTNTSHPQLISDLPLETGKATRVIWGANSRLVIQEREAFAKVWQLTGDGFELLEPLISMEEIEACKHNARHLDDLGHPHCCGDSGLKGVIRAVYDYSWSQLWGQLYMIDLRKLLTNELQNALGKEEDLKMCRAVLEGLGKFAVGSIG